MTMSKFAVLAMMTALPRSMGMKRRRLVVSDTALTALKTVKKKFESFWVTLKNDVEHLEMRVSKMNKYSEDQEIFLFECEKPALEEIKVESHVLESDVIGKSAYELFLDYKKKWLIYAHHKAKKDHSDNEIAKVYEADSSSVNLNDYDEDKTLAKNEEKFSEPAEEAKNKFERKLEELKKERRRFSKDQREATIQAANVELGLIPAWIKKGAEVFCLQDNRDGHGQLTTGKGWYGKITKAAPDAYGEVQVRWFKDACGHEFKEEKCSYAKFELPGRELPEGVHPDIRQWTI